MMGKKHANTNIHPTAIIHENAVIGKDCQIGAYSIIGENVILGNGNIIHPHVIITGATNIGDNNSFFQFCSIGSTPQVEKPIGQKSELEIGNNNSFREYVTIQPGIEEHGGLTKIHDHNLFMINSHVGHDCSIGNYNRLTNNSSLAGHVKLDNHVIVSGYSGIQQFSHLGDFSFVSCNSMVSADVPPYCLVEGNKACLVGINTVGLKRGNFSGEEIAGMKNIFISLFMEQGTFATKLASLKDKYNTGLSKSFFDFLDNSKKITPYRKNRHQKKESYDNI